ncbi:MAG: phosphotransferase family protein [Dehalococcoidia bacterium]
MAGPNPSSLVDVAKLEAYLDAHLGGPGQPVTVEKHTAGFSNETFYVNRGDERYVMRRPPAGPLLPTAHDVVREYRFLAALAGRARVPKPALLCEDTAIIGAPFYVMERKDGYVIRDAIPEAFDRPEARRKIGEEMVDALVEMHAVDWRAAGLTGRDSGYVERQLNRWASQWELTKPRTRELPGLDRITAWMRANMPAEVPHTVVHGDYKLDNVMFAKSNEPRLIAIFDWEMATIGDPLADLGYLLHSWSGGRPVPGYEDRVPARPPLTSLEGFPAVPEMMARYEAKSGRSMKDFLFYRVLASYKLIVILEGLYMHYKEGAAANPGAAEFEWGVPMRIVATQRLIDQGQS